MIAAIYARVSKEKSGVTEDAKSPARQIENARAFALARGWRVDAAHIFVDDGISGAEFAKRPGFMKMMGLLPSPPFSALIVSEQKSIGREAFETNYAIKQLAQAGVEIFEYVHGTSLTPKNYLDKMMSTFRAGADEAHREQTSERVHEAHARSARAGRVVGGRVFGYRNRVIFKGEDRDGNPLRSHVEREINQEEAAVVRRIFDLYDSGFGLKRISGILTREGATAPVPFVRRDATKVGPVVGWAPSTVRAILRRELYRGQVVWNRSRKRPVAWGAVKQRPRPESEWLRADAEALRIVDEQLWQRVAARRADVEGRAVRFEGGRISGRPPRGGVVNLLAGLATCALCGGGLIVETSPRKRGRVPEYICHRRRVNGTCQNTLRLKVEEVNEAVLQAVEEHALTPEAIEQVILLSERSVEQDAQAMLARERKDVEKRIARLVAAVETAPDVASLAAKLRELEARRAAIDAEAAALRPVPRLEPALLENRLAEWRRLLRASTTQGRTVLQRILRGRLTFTPIVHKTSGAVTGYRFEGPTRFDRLFTGIAVDPAAWATLLRGLPRRHGPTPEELAEALAMGPDADYGRLLDRAQVKLEKGHAKGVASPAGQGIQYQHAVQPVLHLEGPLPA